MNYKKLIEAHRLFYEGEYRAFNYDGYMKLKNWKIWMSPDLPSHEIRKLFNFIKSWDRFFQGDVETFQEIYREVYPTIHELKNERIEETNFAEELKIKVRDVFDKVANCPLIDMNPLMRRKFFTQSFPTSSLCGMLTSKKEWWKAGKEEQLMLSFSYPKCNWR